MPRTILRIRAPRLLSGLLALSATAAQAQSSPAGLAKLDAVLSASVRAGNTATTRVIIQTTPDGIPGLRQALQTSGNPVLLEHPLIGAITTRDYRFTDKGLDFRLL